MTRTILALGSAMLLILSACGGGATATAPAARCPQRRRRRLRHQPAKHPRPRRARPPVERHVRHRRRPARSPRRSRTSRSIPAPITAKVGDVIAWTNNDSTTHTATVKSDTTCTTANLASGETGAIMFNVAGSYDFICKIHSNMTGKVEVS